MDDKVLILDNSLPLNKEYVIETISNWLKSRKSRTISE